jgi:acetylornithine deacetylase/succinyl-diaminopimelate desuccinylase
MAAHGSVPEKGIDAIEKTSKLVARLSALELGHSTIKHPLLGSPKLHMSTIEGGTGWSVVPESCSLRLERRNLPGEQKDVAVREVRKVVDDLSAEDPEFRATVTEVLQQPAMRVSRREPIVRAVSAAYESVMRRRATVVGIPYWTDAALLVNGAGIPTCVFGPGDITQAHSADEFISVDEVVKAASIFERTMRDFCGEEES